MLRLSLFTLGALSGYIAWALVSRPRSHQRARIPASRAAEMLQQAWADHHTRA